MLNSQGNPTRTEAIKQQKQFESTVDGYEVRENNEIIKRRVGVLVREPRQRADSNAAQRNNDTTLNIQRK